MNRVVITGMGWITPMGHSVDAVWPRLLKGESGIAYTSIFDASTFPTSISAEVKDFRLAVKPQDERVSLKRAEHHGHPRRIQEVRRRLVAAAGAVQPQDRPVTQNAQRVQPFGRDVDVTLLRGGRHEKELLLVDKRPVMVVQPLETLSHEKRPVTGTAGGRRSR